MKKILILSSCYSIIIYIILVFFFSFKVFDMDLRGIPQYTPDTPPLPLGEISGQQIIRQEFIAGKNSLSRIDIFFGDYRRKNTKDVFFSLYDNENNLLYKEIFNASIVKDLGNKQFNVGWIHNSKDKRFYFEILSPESIDGNAITVFTTDSFNPKTKLFYNKNLLKNKQLLFLTYSSPKWINFDTLLDRLSQYKPWFFKKKYLSILIFVYIFSNIFMIYYIISLFRKKDG